MESSFGNDFVCKLWVMQDYRALIFDLHVFMVVEAWDIIQHIFYTHIFSVTQTEIKTVFIVLQKTKYRNWIDNAIRSQTHKTKCVNIACVQIQSERPNMIDHKIVFLTRKAIYNWLHDDGITICCVSCERRRTSKVYIKLGKL